MMKLHPHHLLCINFFEYQGYSDDFVINMTNVIKYLEDNAPIIEFTFEDDIICSKCPNFTGEKCKESLINELDNAVLKYISLNNKTSYKELKEKVFNEIILKVTIDEVCSDCCWMHICLRKQRELIKLKSKVKKHE